MRTSKNNCSMEPILIKPENEHEPFAVDRKNYAAPVTADEVEIHFEKGIFYITQDSSLFFDGCKKVKITGCGEDTKIYFGRKTQFRYDDSVIKISGRENAPTSVVISDLTISYDIHKKHEPLDKDGKEYADSNLKFDEAVLYLMKCYHVKGFTMTNVKTELEGLLATNLDLRNCSDIDIHDCTFINYNRSTIGGCLWLRGNVENVSVHDNVFRKHGNDELFAVWNNNKMTDVEYTEDQYVSMHNISFCHNWVFYQANGGSWGGSCNVLLTVSTNQEFMVRKSNVGGGKDVDVADNEDAVEPASAVLPGDTEADGQKTCHTMVSGIEISGNEIKVCAPTNRVLRLAFDRHTTYSGISVSGNRITHTAWSFSGSEGNTQLCDFELYYDMDFACIGSAAAQDGSFCNEPIEISGNTILSHFKPRDEKDAFVCVDAGGVNVRFERNTVTDVTGPVNGDGYSTAGLTLLQSVELSSRFFLKDNFFRGIHCLASLKSEREDVFVGIMADGNMFEGDTRIFCNTQSQIRNMALDFLRNEFYSDYQVFFLQNSAKCGMVCFKENKVLCREDGKNTEGVRTGILVSLPDSNQIDSLVVDVRDNMFIGMAQDENGGWEKNLYHTLTGCEKVTLRRSGNFYKGVVD